MVMSASSSRMLADDPATIIGNIRMALSVIWQHHFSSAQLEEQCRAAPGASRPALLRCRCSSIVSGFSGCSRTGTLPVQLRSSIAHLIQLPGNSVAKHRVPVHRHNIQVRIVAGCIAGQCRPSSHLCIFCRSRSLARHSREA